MKQMHEQTTKKAYDKVLTGYPCVRDVVLQKAENEAFEKQASTAFGSRSSADLGRRKENFFAENDPAYPVMMNYMFNVDQKMVYHNKSREKYIRTSTIQPEGGSNWYTCSFWFSA